jgi:mannobiose 2-epimerase
MTLKNLQREAQDELNNILNYWLNNAIDTDKGGFFGKIDNDNHIHPDAPKGSVLNSRILWTFSAAYRFSNNNQHLDAATRAFQYLIEHFIDPEYGGVYWTVDATGRPLDTKKQIYASAFALYGLTEYFRCSADEEAKRYAIDLYNTILKYGYDEQHGGFFEAFSGDWKELKDQRLSDKDANEKKSANTNLHVIEAFANLFRIWPDKTLRNRIQELLGIFQNQIIDPSGGHLQLFFNERWVNRPDVISYGHDIEAAWLLLDCAEVIADPDQVTLYKEHAIFLTKGAEEGLDRDGGLWYEFDPRSNKLIKQKHWWPQAEALVGFFNAWQITNEKHFLQRALETWNFIKLKMLSDSGEWYWGIFENDLIMRDGDKVGLWKCPYHNSRACLEIIRRT